MRATAFSFIAFAAFLATSVVGQESERRVVMRNWKFEWTVIESGDASFSIVKTDDVLYTLLRSGGFGIRSIRLSPVQAAQIARPLWNTDRELRALRTIAEQKNESARKQVDVEGGIVVIYVFDPTRGGTVRVAREGSFMSDVVLSVTEAEALAQKMRHAVQLSQAVDAKIRPNE